MMGATRGKPLEDFATPAGSVARTVCAETGMLATDQCPNTASELYDEGSEPADYCTSHPGRPLNPNEHSFTRPDSLRDDMHDIDQDPGKEEIHI
jgi:penicillin-binding protein 1A